jgi:hypothetical protein
VWISTIESLQDGRIALGSPEVQLVATGMKRCEKGGSHVTGAKDRHARHVVSPG